VHVERGEGREVGRQPGAAERIMSSDSENDSWYRESHGSDRATRDDVDMSTKGRHLLASPALTDPNFDRTVVFMLEHGDEGALGVVINRPSELPVAGTIDDWKDLAPEPSVIFVGGPVSASSVIAIATMPTDETSRHWNVVALGLGTVDLDSDPSEVPGIEKVRMFAGYASWAPGQLDTELLDDAWIVVDAEAEDIHVTDPDELWWRVVGRQRGPLNRLRFYPRDPSDN
jgi:putative transcriptional regulator